MGVLVCVLLPWVFMRVGMQCVRSVVPVYAILCQTTSAPLAAFVCVCVCVYIRSYLQALTPQCRLLGSS